MIPLSLARPGKRRGEAGFVVSVELIFVATILVIGAIVGWSSVRSAVVTELADVGAAVGNLNQTYTFSGATGHHSTVTGSSWSDAKDTCDTEGFIQDVGQAARCVSICTEAPLAERADPNIN